MPGGIYFPLDLQEVASQKWGLNMASLSKDGAANGHVQPAKLVNNVTAKYLAIERFGITPSRNEPDRKPSVIRNPKVGSGRFRAILAVNACWVSISGSGSDASFACRAKNQETRNPETLLLGDKA